jgi:Trp operon repressor
MHLHNHVLKHMEMDAQQEEVHNALLSDLLRESRREQFVDRLRDYVVFINRIVNAIKLRRNEPLP